MPTQRFKLPFIEDSQAQKHLVHNTALEMLDGLMPAIAVSATTTTAPGSPVDGEVYIVPTGGTFGSVSVDAIAIWYGGEWVEIPCTYGHRVLVLDEGRYRIFAGAKGWLNGMVMGQFDATLGLRAIDLSATLTSGTQHIFSGAIPTRAIVLGVTTWVDTAIAGPANIKTGLSGDLEKFGSWIGPSAGSSNIGVVGPYATYSPADVLVTAQDDVTAFSAGVVRISVQIIEPGAAPI